MTCFDEKRELCANSLDCGRCAGFDYAADCCGTCEHYIEDGTKPWDWYDEHPGTCGAVADMEEDGGTFDDCRPVMWYSPPCLMFDPA